MSLSFDDEFEKLGEAEVKRMLLERDNADSIILSYAPAWLALKDAERIARSEAREEMTLSIAKEANRIASIALHNSKWANIWAAIAALIAAIAMYIAYACIQP